jgi:XXXCH domain-containing protein
VSTVEKRYGLPNYGQLKERMKADFKQIRKAVKKDRSIDAELVRSFCSDALLMTTYPGKGDEYYPAFREQVERLAKAVGQGDGPMLAEAVAAVRRMEKACHKRFK